MAERAPTLARPVQHRAAALPRRLMAAFLAVAVVGWGAAAFLTAVHFWALPLPAGVDPQGSLAVITSRWAYVGPVPLALVGALYYVAMIVLGTTALTTASRAVERALLPVTVVGFLSSVGLVYLQLGPIGAICPFCMVSATATTLLLAIELVVRRLGGAAATPPWRPTAVWPVVFVAVIALTLTGMFGVTLAPIPGA